MLSLLYPALFLNVWFATRSPGGERLPVFLFQLDFLLYSETGSGATQGGLRLSKFLSLPLMSPACWMPGAARFTWLCCTNNGNQRSQHPRQAVYKLSLKYSP